MRNERKAKLLPIPAMLKRFALPTHSRLGRLCLVRSKRLLARPEFWSNGEWWKTRENLFAVRLWIYFTLARFSLLASLLECECVLVLFFWHYTHIHMAHLTFISRKRDNKIYILYKTDTFESTNNVRLCVIIKMDSVYVRLCVCVHTHNFMTYFTTKATTINTMRRRHVEIFIYAHTDGLARRPTTGKKQKKNPEKQKRQTWTIARSKSMHLCLALDRYASEFCLCACVCVLANWREVHTGHIVWVCIRVVFMQEPATGKVQASRKTNATSVKGRRNTNTDND